MRFLLFLKTILLDGGPLLLPRRSRCGPSRCVFSSASCLSRAWVFMEETSSLPRDRRRRVPFPRRFRKALLSFFCSVSGLTSLRKFFAVRRTLLEIGTPSFRDLPAQVRLLQTAFAAIRLLPHPFDSFSFFFFIDTQHKKTHESQATSPLRSP